MKEDAPRVIKIPAKPEATRQAEARRQLRVAAYCRVSTKEVKALESKLKIIFSNLSLSIHKKTEGNVV